MLYYKVLNCLVIIFGAMVGRHISFYYYKNRVWICYTQKRFWKLKTEMLSVVNGFKSWGENKHIVYSLSLITKI